MKRITAFLIFAVLTCQICSCSGNTVNNETDGSESTTDETVSTESNPDAAERRQSMTDNLPDDLNFNGAVVNILTRIDEPFSYEMGVESENGEVVNDSIYRRNRSVEERLDVTINIDASAEGNATDKIRASVLSGDDIYTICTGTSFHTPSLVREGCFVNLNKVKYLDFDMPWWIQNLRDEMTLYDQLYFMAGDLTLSLLQYESAIFANQKLLKDYSIDEDLYDLVNEGKWTLDKLAELSGKVSADLNGDGAIDENDRFGLGVVDSTRIMALGYGAGMVITKKDSSGIPELAMNSEHTIDVFNKVNALLWDKSSFDTFNGTFPTASDESHNFPVQQQMFMADQILFFTGNMLDTEVFRDMKSDYSILPFPKYDEAQENYISYSRDSFSVVVIPVTCQNTDLAGAVCEAMASESYRSVTPAYYDVALKGKYTRDERSADMMDLIRSSITFNWGLGNSFSMGYVSHIFQNAIQGGEGFMSRYAAKEKTVETGYKKLIECYSNQK